MKRLLLAAVPFLLAACGTPAPAPVTVTAVAQIRAGDDFNDTDVMFLQMLAHHQEQGLAMTATATTRAQSREVRMLAAAVRATEQDELTMMRSWLKQWNRPTTADLDAARHADHGGLPGTGPDEIKALTTVPAADFDSAFLNLFLAHQHNAIEMAQREMTGGGNALTKAYAGRVRESRQGEIRQMLKLMNG